jgi:hypothetical protein
MVNLKLADRILRIVGVGIFVSGVAFMTSGIWHLNKAEENARREAMYHYRSVGNGGALSEMHGKTNPERREMYRKISRVYEQAGGKGYFPDYSVIMRGSR